MRMRDWSSDVCSSDLTLTVVSSAQSGGAFASWHWLENAGLAAGAFEALVLSLGLADRSLQVRRERDEVRELADIDGLTGVSNHRHIHAQLAGLVHSARRHGRPRERSEELRGGTEGVSTWSARGWPSHHKKK